MDELKYKDGKFTVNGNEISGLMPILSAQTYDLSDNPEYFEVKLDSDGKIIEGVKKDGTKYISEIESKTIDELKEKIDTSEFDTYGELPYYSLPTEKDREEGYHGSYMNKNGSIIFGGTEFSAMSIKVYRVKENETYKISDLEHKTQNDDFCNVAFFEFYPKRGMTGIPLVIKDNDGQGYDFNYTPQKDGYICIWKRNDNNYGTLCGEIHPTLVDKIKSLDKKIDDIDKKDKPYYGKLMTTIGDSTSGMQRWQPTTCKKLGCRYDSSAINGGTLCAIYYSTVTAVSLDSDIVTVQYGTNDWANVGLHLGTINDMADPTSGEGTTYCGALNYVCKWLSENLLAKNPYAKILMWTPLQRLDGIAWEKYARYGRNEKGEIINHEGKSLADFADAIIAIASKWGFPVIDTHRRCGFNDVTIGTWNKNYVPSPSSVYEDWSKTNPVDGKVNFVGNMLYDGLHPDYSPGGEILGDIIANEILKI